MRIDANKRLNGPARNAAPRQASGGGEVFRVGGDSPAARAETSGAASALSGVDALLALQAVGDDSQAGPRLRHGHVLLDLLEDLRIGLLGGGVSPVKLDHLLDSLRRRPARIDGEGVEDVLDEIELRARVELAKLGREAA